MFSERMKELRRKNHMTQKEMAKVLHVSTSTIGMYEQGRRDPDAQLLRKLSNTFHVSADYLLEVQLKNETTELSSMVEALADKLWEQGTVTYHGRKLQQEEVSKAVTAIKMGVRLAMKANQG